MSCNMRTIYLTVLGKETAVANCGSVDPSGAGSCALKASFDELQCETFKSPRKGDCRCQLWQR
jgi:hypothetical protein